MNLLNKKLILISLTIILLIIIVLLGIRPKIYLLGDEIVELPLNGEYKEEGATAYSLYTDISNRITIKDNINSKKIGTYKVIYKVKHFNKEYKKTRTVKVIDTIEPIIQLKGTVDLKLCPNQNYQEEGYLATDNYDGDLTSKVIKHFVDDGIVYRVEDSSGNIGRARRNIKFIDDESPAITIIGGDMTVYLNEQFNDPGIEAIDNCDGNLNTKVKVDGKVDTTKEGTYKIKYSVIDANNNKAEVTRTIDVIAKPKTDKTIYLTFDDGPSKTITPEILKVLKEENVKATFFVVNHSDDLNYLIKQEYSELHTVALHSYTHNYKYIYSSSDIYFNDLELIKNKVKNITGYDSNIIRFPGGSSNSVSKFNPGIMTTIASETLNRGYIYFDWNVDSMDAGGAKDKNDVYNNVITHLNNKTNVVLMHDYENNYKTLEALRDIIKYGKENGYSFDRITTNTPQIKHRINN